MKKSHNEFIEECTWQHVRDQIHMVNSDLAENSDLLSVYRSSDIIELQKYPDKIIEKLRNKIEPDLVFHSWGQQFRSGVFQFQFLMTKLVKMSA
jgi:hypothetical protein